MKLNRHALGLLILTLVVGGTGCAYVKQQDRAFGADAQKALPYVRQYAMGHLTNISGEEMRVIAGTEPVIDHASYSRVSFRWPQLCTVVAGPPPCMPQCIFDDRPRKK